MEMIGEQDMARISETVLKIRNLKAPIQELADRAKDTATRTQGESINWKYSQKFWSHKICWDGLIRLRLLTENNFVIIESLNLLAATRYLFELLLWFRLVKKDARYALLYFRNLVKTQIRYYEDLRGHYEHEACRLEELGREEERLVKDCFARAASGGDLEGNPQGLHAATQQVQETIDNRAAQEFLMLAPQARDNGYAFTAYLIRQQLIPKTDQAIAELREERDALNAAVADAIRAILPDRAEWNWAEQAKKANLGTDYNFIYTYASRLLHATPASVTTDKKNLEHQEAFMFLKYFHVRALEVMDLGKSMLAQEDLQ